MKTLKFRTTIKCSGCIEKVSPFLNEIVPGGWSVDILTPAKTLTVDAGSVTAGKVEEKVKQAGFEIERTED